MTDEMDKLFTEAEAKGLWFFSSYQSLWFSPRELREAQADGRFKWGVVNWELRPPKEHEAELLRKAEAVEQELRDWKQRVKKG